MKSAALLVVVIALMACVADAYAMGGGGGRGRGHASNGDSTKGNWHGSVPEPSTMYALGSGLAFLGGATWYLRRRK